MDSGARNGEFLVGMIDFIVQRGDMNLTIGITVSLFHEVKWMVPEVKYFEENIQARACLR